MKFNTRYIAIIASLPILTAIFGFLASASFVSECGDYSCSGNITYIFTDGIPIIVWTFYFFNLITSFFILLNDRKKYNNRMNMKRFIALFIPAIPLAINLIIGFKLKEKDKSFFSWWWILNLFGWGDIYKKP